MNQQKTENLNTEISEGYIEQEKQSTDSGKAKRSVWKLLTKGGRKEKFLKKLGYQRTGAFLGLDVGSFSVKMVELKRSKNGLRIINAGMEKIYDPSEEVEAFSQTSLRETSDQTSAIVKSIRQITRNQKIKTDKVASTLSGDSVVERFIRVPLLKKRELDKILQWEAKKFLNIPPEEMIFDYSVFQEDREAKKLELLLAVSQKKLILKHLNLLKVAGLKPVALETKSQALHNALLNRLSIKDEVVALLDIGANCSILNISQANLLRLSRNIKYGGHDLTQALANQLGWSIRQAENFKKGKNLLSNKGSGSQETADLNGKSNLIQGIISDHVEKLTAELQRSFEYYLAEFEKEKIDLLYITGGGSKLKDLDKSLENRLKVKTEIFNPLDNIEEVEGSTQDWEDLGPPLTIAFGSATWKEKF